MDQSGVGRFSSSGVTQPGAHSRRSLDQPAKCRRALSPARNRSLLAERANRVNPRGSQRWDQAREYRNHNKEQRKHGDRCQGRCPVEDTRGIAEKSGNCWGITPERSRAIANPFDRKAGHAGQNGPCGKHSLMA